MPMDGWGMRLVAVSYDTRFFTTCCRDVLCFGDEDLLASPKQTRLGSCAMGLRGLARNPSARNDPCFWRENGVFGGECCAVQQKVALFYRYPA